MQVDRETQNQYEGAFEKAAVATAEGSDRLPRKAPIYQDGCFWNINEQLTEAYVQDYGLEQMDLKIQYKALIEHGRVFKKSFFSYFKLRFEEPRATLKDLPVGQKFSQVHKSIQEMTSLMKECKNLCADHQDLINSQLSERPESVVMFCLFSRVISASQAPNLFVLLAKAIQIKNCLIADGISLTDSEVISYIGENIADISDQLAWMRDKNDTKTAQTGALEEEQFQQAIKRILYTCTVALNGALHNKYYENYNEEDDSDGVESLTGLKDLLIIDEMNRETTAKKTKMLTVRRRVDLRGDGEQVEKRRKRSH